ncbi:hypothetical protein [Mesorhizobium sp. M0488]|uniref:hypothetical protein n=1 Tax=unclassified Mesorhizobium TaxID=325217 RepID=UPI00333660A7
MGTGELVGRRADVHVGVVQDQILDMDKLALEPQRGGGIVEMRARDKTLAHRTSGQPKNPLR